MQWISPSRCSRANELEMVFLFLPTETAISLIAAVKALRPRIDAFCISQSSGTVRVFQNGEMKLHIEPLARPHVWQPLRMETSDDDAGG